MGAQLTLCGSRTLAHQYHAVLPCGRDIWLGAHAKSDWDVVGAPLGAYGPGYDYHRARAVPTWFAGFHFPRLVGDTLRPAPTLDFLLYVLNRRIDAQLARTHFGAPVTLVHESGQPAGQITFWPLPGIQAATIQQRVCDAAYRAFLAGWMRF